MNENRVMDVQSTEKMRGTEAFFSKVGKRKSGKRERKGKGAKRESLVVRRWRV